MSDNKAFDSIRLSDRILSALELALSQEDLQTSDLLMQALDLSMTRSTGGGEFIERRDYPPELAGAHQKLKELQAKQSS